MSHYDTEARELVQALRRRPGRGGVRLNYQQAELALELIEVGARAVRRLQRQGGPIGSRVPKERDAEVS